MVRIGAVSLMVLSLFVLFGCKTTDTQETGLELSFDSCLSFEAWVWIDSKYVGSYSSDLPAFLDVKVGPHSLYAKSNLIAGDTCVCWTRNFRISEGKTTPLVLNCVGAGCCKKTGAAVR